MGNQGLKYAAIAAVILAVLLGLMAYRMTLSVAESAREQARADAEQQELDQAQAAMTLAVVALQPLAATRPITQDDVALKPVSVVPERYFTKVEDVIARAPLIDIDAGAPVTPRYFRESNVLARLIPDAHQAMSLEVSDVIAVGGFIRPGDRVDVLIYLRGGQTEPQSRLLLEEALVLAYQDRIIERPEGLTEAEGRPERSRRSRTAVLAVPEEQTTRVMLGASVGEIRLALRRQAIGESDADAPADDGGSPLPRASAAPEQTAVASAEDETERQRPITLRELTQLQSKAEAKATPAPYVIQVFRGSQAEKVTD